MENNIEGNKTPRAGSQLRRAVRAASFGLLFFSLLGTGIVWAGTNSFGCSDTIWQTSLALGLFLSLLAWVIYLPFRNTDKLLGNGLLSIFTFLCLFWLFGFAGFYFYFLFAPINIWLRITAISGITTSLIYRVYIITHDINEAFQHHKKLFDRMYWDEGDFFTFSRQAVGLLEKSRANRNPFKSIHLYAAMIVAPFTLTLNKILTPALGEGHGVFLVEAFFSAPILLWGAEIFTQAIITMIYYPIKLQLTTGKPVLMKNW